MPACWETRGCDATMQETCPHVVPDKYSPCVLDCMYTFCDRPQHEMATDLDLLLDPTVDRNAAMKEACRSCAHFLKHGPRVQ